MSRLARLYRSQSRAIPEQGLSHRFVSRREDRSEIHREPYRSHSPSDLRLVTLVSNLARAVRALERGGRAEALDGTPDGAGVARRRRGAEDDWLASCLLDEMSEDDDERWRKRRSRPARAQAPRRESAGVPERQQPAAPAGKEAKLGRLLAWRPARKRGQILQEL